MTSATLDRALIGLYTAETRSGLKPREPGATGFTVRIGIIVSSRIVFMMTAVSSARRAASSMIEVGEASTTTSASGKSAGLGAQGPSENSKRASVHEKRS